MEQKFNYYKTLKEIGITYLGKVAQSAKMEKSLKNGTMTYCLYLAPSTMSGFNVCPNSETCKALCLNGSGHNKYEMLHDGLNTPINMSRIKKTRLLFEHKDIFMKLMIYEIKRWKRRAEKENYEFSVRINGTSDLSPLKFKDESGRNILEIFSDVQFYDYTKIASRKKLMDEYKNYFLVLSYNGRNEEECKEWLADGGNVAVVFFNKENKLPKSFMGYDVCDGNLFDMRYLDPRQRVVGLHFHKTAANYVFDPVIGKRHFVMPKNDFVVLEDNDEVVW